MTLDLRRVTAAPPVARRGSREGDQKDPRRREGVARQRRRWGLVFVLPALVLVALLIVLPSIQGLYYSFTDWNGRSAHWVGLDNYINGIFLSPDFGRIAINSLCVVLSVPFGVGLSLIVANLLANSAWGRGWFRAIYFLPIALSWVVIGITFAYLLSGRGPINALLSAMGFGLFTQDWLGGETSALVSIILVFNWSYFGINVVLLFTGMTTADPSITEAARLDGAHGVKMFIHIVIPQVRRYIELSLIVTMAAAITQIFALIYTMTAGGPGVATTTLEYALYTRSFSLGHFSQGAAFGILLFLISLVFAVVRLRAGVKADDD
ncbi:carbohydrate ABC transporter permease [Microbacterium rhizomatis]|uniref:Sugar ABC transporter permease n=1 Tax=Microbacterium rhizomatis TaxID=1631477 RepID=A0A5J5J3F1_9MICO|nr:sugar ABC transporter permease [Microbacterium rhizomatis]KAA9108109.1 sugar ABC transporter permease [Microbacterium rhizomatis]